MKKTGIKFVVLIAIALTTFSYGGYSYQKLGKELRKEIGALQEQLNTATTSLAQSQSENAALNQTLQAEQGKNNIFEAKINEVSTIVGALQKLSATDPELLRKYSKVYFLSENYIPAQLSSIESGYLYEQGRPQLIHAGTAPYLQKILEASGQAGINLRVASAYRSFYDQESVKAGYKVLYGSGANQFSADQGYSEHQLGTAIDFTTPEVDGVFSAFEKSPAFPWLNDNAYKFGFVLSYPKNNSYYQFEPWHWRFVGVALAKYLREQGKNFYDLDQREINGYLITLFN